MLCLKYEQGVGQVVIAQSLSARLMSNPGAELKAKENRDLPKSFRLQVVFPEPVSINCDSPKNLVSAIILFHL